MIRMLFAVVVATCGLAVTAGTAGAWVPATSDPETLASSVAQSLDEYWSATLTQAGRRYVAPRAVRIYRRPIRTRGCGMTPANNASYCPADTTIYIAYGLFRNLIVRANADYAAGTVLAHEWGHHIQRQLGWLSWATQRRYYAGAELQADCYAGMFAGYAERRGLLEAGDLDEAGRLMLAIGDEPGIRRNDPRAHGTSEERLHWFTVGYESGTLEACDAVYSVVHA